MKIVLLRHGEPEISLSNMLKMKCSANQLKAVIRNYNDSGLNKQNAPTFETLCVAKTCRSLVCSDLRRFIESAWVLAVPKVDLVDAFFRESGKQILGIWSLRIPFKIINCRCGTAKTIPPRGLSFAIEGKNPWKTATWYPQISPSLILRPFMTFCATDHIGAGDARWKPSGKALTTHCALECTLKRIILWDSREL